MLVVPCAVNVTVAGATAHVIVVAVGSGVQLSVIVCPGGPVSCSGNSNVSPGFPVAVSPVPGSGVKVGVPAASKVAVTVVAAFTVTVQGLVAAHPPPAKLVKLEPLAAVAVSTTCVPDAKLPEHDVAGQSIPPLSLFTDPVPVPAKATVSTKLEGAVTVSVVCPATPPCAAEIVALPAFTPVASPALVIVAIVVSLEAQAIEFVKFCVVPSLNVPVAVN